MVASIDSVFQSLDNRSPVELLMVGCSANQAHQCAIALRNNGQAVHVESAETPETLAQMLETTPGDMVIINADASLLNKELAVDAVREINPAASIILISQTPEKLLQFTMQMELRDLIKSDDVQHLAFAIQREHQTLLLRQELTQQRNKLREAEHRFDTLMGKSRDAIAYVHEGMHIHANRMYCEMFGIEDEGDIEGLPLMDLIVSNARKSFKKTLRKHEEDQSFSTNVACQGIDSTTFNVSMEFSPAEVDGEPCTQIVIRDQSLHRELQARIDELTNRDPHTQLFNRHAFMERLESVLGSAAAAEAGLIQISVSNCTALRDSAGIEKADSFLKTVAHILQHNAAKAHTIARFGDHDFIILDAGSENLTEMAERCLSALRTHDYITSSGVLNTPEFSIGVTATPAGETVSAHELLNRSCKTVQLAQNDANKQLVVFSEQLLSLGTAHQEADPAVVDLIDHALEHDEFQLAYQPIVSLQGDTRENYSALLRLVDAKGEEQEPEAFWTHAKHANRLAEIDRWVVRNAIKELAKHRQDGKKINFHITLSHDGINDDSMLLWVCDCLREFKAKGTWLAFQFREIDLRNNLQTARGLMDGLKKINCKIAISHFSNGPNSENLLRYLPVDIVKLAPDFMSGLANSPEQQDELQGLNQQLQENGIKTIASGVEDANSLAALWNIGVNFIQGYFLQEPSLSISFEDD